MEKNVTIQLAGNLEPRPIAMLVQVASTYDSTIYLQTEGKRVNAKSIMGMMSLTLKAGDEILVTADGVDEAQAVEGIEKYLTNKE